MPFRAYEYMGRVVIIGIHVKVFQYVLPAVSAQVDRLSSAIMTKQDS